MTQECPQLQNLPANVRTFWEEKQRALQDTLLRFSYGIFIEPVDVILHEQGGLLYLMRQNLWFEDFPKSSTFSTLFQQGAEYTKTRIQIPRASIVDVSLLPSGELGHALLGTRSSSAGILALFRLYKPRPNTLLLAGTDVDGHSLRCAFRELDDPDAWYKALSTPQRV